MRLHYYRFPENTPEETRLNEGCAVILKTGREIYVDHIRMTVGRWLIVWMIRLAGCLSRTSRT